MNNKITILSRLRNESLVLPDFLNHIDSFCDEAFFLDDCSLDNSVEILESYPKTKKILRNYFHEGNQSFCQTSQRKILLDWARIYAKNDFLMLIEPDERICFDFNKLEEYDRQGKNIIYMQLFDSYLTKDDREPYRQGDKLENLRKWWGPEMREIGFLFKKDADYDIEIPACRQPQIKNENKIVDGFVKHYGKSLSVNHWEETCDYYIKSVPMLAEKWKQRKGKAIHEKSDFGRDLYQWDQLINNPDLWIKI